MKIRDRIIDFRRVKASDLLPNPRNWRTHPKAQADALRGILADVGYADALLVRETPAGLMLIDGHLRAETTPDQEVPVLVLDVTEAEADKILATLDPLAAMATANKDALGVLLADLETDNEALQALLDGLAKQNGIELGGGNGDAVDHATLAERFGVPPFSVLDARQGYWQDRKRAWLSLGIQSELGRGGGITWGVNPDGSDPRRELDASGGLQQAGARRRKRQGNQA